MTNEFALILEFIGEVIIAFSVIRVHSHVLKEHKLDRDVFKTIRTERVLLSLGILFMLAGYLIQIFA